MMDAFTRIFVNCVPLLLAEQLFWSVYTADALVVQTIAKNLYIPMWCIQPIHCRVYPNAAIAYGALLCSAPRYTRREGMVALDGSKKSRPSCIRVDTYI